MSAVDFSQSQPLGLSARNGAVVTPNNDEDLSFVTRAVYVGTGGNLNVDLAGGQTIVIPSVPAGAFLPICVKRIRAASTTATGIVAFW
jgi:hypothetical protein